MCIRDRGKDVLRGTDVTLHQGALLCLLGGNGAGKTTLLQALAGFRKPYRGKVKLAKGQRLCMLPPLDSCLPQPERPLAAHEAIGLVECENRPGETEPDEQVRCV